METKDFLGRITPTEGVYFAATPATFIRKEDGREVKYYKHKPCNDVYDLARACLNLSNKRKTSYYAMASFKQAEYYVNGKKKQRTQDNVYLVRSLWLDIDCGPTKDYPTQKEGLKALKAALKKIKFPTPTFIVNSGYGLHVYWAFTKDVEKDVWQKVATKFQALIQSTGLIIDPVTADAARILRPIGTNNYKVPESPMPVRLLTSGSDYRFSDLAKLVLTTAKEMNITAQEPTKKKFSSDLNNALGANLDEFPPSFADKIADKCAVLRDMRDTKGAAQTEHEWYNCLGILRHTEEGEAVAQEWSSGHEGYDPSYTRAKMDQWGDLPPTRCETMRLTCDQCSSCKLSCNSPIVLGFPDPVHQTEIIASDSNRASVDDTESDDEGDGTAASVETLPAMPPAMQGDYAWNEGKGLLARIKGQGDDPDIWVPICSQLPVPDFIYLDENEEYKLRLRSRIKPYIWTEGDLDLGTCTVGGVNLLKDMGNKCGVTVKDEGKLLVRYMKTWVDHVRNTTDLTRMCDRMGWQTDGTSFLLGSTLYKEDGTKTEVVISRQLAPIVHAHIPKGDKNVFIDAIDHLYNKPNYEEYQFTFLAALGSPLIKLIHSHAMGITHAMWSEGTGSGKSTVCMAAMANFGDPGASGQKADGQGGGATDYAISVMAGQRNNLPILIDETTEWGPKRIGEFAYRFASGMAKMQGKAEGGLRDTSKLNWNSVCFMTSNDPVASMIMSHRRDSKAQLSRIFDVKFIPRKLNTDDQMYIERLWNNTGCTGAEYIQYVVTNREKVTALLLKMRERLYKETGLTQEARFWVIYGAAVLAAGHISKLLGQHKFDMKALETWLIKQIKRMDTNAVDAGQSVEDILRDLLADKQSGMIVTFNEPTKPGEVSPFADGYGAPRMTVTGRLVYSTGDIYMPKSEIKAWCAKNNVDMNAFREKLETNRWLVHEDLRYYVGKGTSVQTPRVRCWHINMDPSKAMRLVGGPTEVSEANEVITGS